MPIKPENRARYPANWKQVSTEAKERARWRCQHPGCDAEQYAVGKWKLRNGVWRWNPLSGNGPCDAAGQGREWPSMLRLTYSEARQIAADADWEREHLGVQPLIVIVLTVAHLDHNPENCEPTNLRAWCQRHHLAYDHDQHRANAQTTRRSRLAAADLFDEPEASAHVHTLHPQG